MNYFVIDFGNPKTLCTITLLQKKLYLGSTYFSDWLSELLVVLLLMYSKYVYLRKFV